MSDFRRLDDTVLVSPQITVADVETARTMGIRVIVNNRPEGESEDQTEGSKIAAAAQAAGMDYIAIPITHSGFSHGQVSAMAETLEKAQGPVLAYCRSGTRSALLWALAQSSKGADADRLSSAAREAGYDLTPIRAMMDMLAANGN